MSSSCGSGVDAAPGVAAAVVRMDMGSLFPEHTLVCALIQSATLPDSWKTDQCEFSLIDADFIVGVEHIQIAAAKALQNVRDDTAGGMSLSKLIVAHAAATKTRERAFAQLQPTEASSNVLYARLDASEKDVAMDLALLEGTLQPMSAVWPSEPDAISRKMAKLKSVFKLTDDEVAGGPTPLLMAFFLGAIASRDS